MPADHPLVVISKSGSKRWVSAADTAARYATVIEPRSSAGADGACTLRAEVRGNFPGSPLVLAFHFALHADGIQSLEITP